MLFILHGTSHMSPLPHSNSSSNTAPIHQMWTQSHLRVLSQYLCVLWAQHFFHCHPLQAIVLGLLSAQLSFLKVHTMSHPSLQRLPVLNTQFADSNWKATDSSHQSCRSQEPRRKDGWEIQCRQASLPLKPPTLYLPGDGTPHASEN